MCEAKGHTEPKLLTLEEAAERSGWPRALLEDPVRQPCVVDDVATFLAFVCYEDHSQAQMCVLRDGVRKLRLEDSLPAQFLHLCRRHRRAIDCVGEAIEQKAGGWQDCPRRSLIADGLDGDVFWWGPGACRRKIVTGGSLQSRLERYQRMSKGLAYLAELSHEHKTPHHLTGERCRALTAKDVRDCVRGQLPMWDRGHCFLGAEGAGSCMHVDQAWWSNVGKNFLGQKLVALWPPGVDEAALQACGGELFRRPLTSKQLSVLALAARVALLEPGDVVSFTGGLPHTTVVVGNELNLTGYESFVNWNPANAELLLRGAARPRGSGVMPLSSLHGLLDDIMDAVEACATGGGLPDCAAPLSSGRSPADLLRAFRLVLLQRPHCAKRMLREPCRTMASTDASSPSSSSSSSRSTDSSDERPDAGSSAGAEPPPSNEKGEWTEEAPEPSCKRLRGAAS